MPKKDTRNSFSTPRGKMQRAKAQQRIIDQGIPAKRKAEAAKKAIQKPAPKKKSAGGIESVQDALLQRGRY